MPQAWSFLFASKRARDPNDIFPSRTFPFSNRVVNEEPPAFGILSLALKEETAGESTAKVKTRIFEGWTVVGRSSGS
ncbi:hypothetical protein FRC18_001683 [Serendipita sp. 400]|nr:hypothetical protein FRC18_001683 [Serendipita sp. 400]